MFWFRDTVGGDLRVEVAFTDASLDLQGLRPGFADDLGRLERACGVRFARLDQVHGRDVAVVDAPAPAAEAAVPVADALLTDVREVGLMVRAADCVPVLVADTGAGVVAAAHAGREGVLGGVVAATVEAVRERGGTGDLTAWVGPHVCGRCYEVPAPMRAAVVDVEPDTWATTSWGTPALDLGAGVEAQLRRAGAEVRRVPGCTLEDPGLHSYRRDGARSGRSAGLVWLR